MEVGDFVSRGTLNPQSSVLPKIFHFHFVAHETKRTIQCRHLQKLLERILAASRTNI
jgi:hypothetical protein